MSTSTTPSRTMRWGAFYKGIAHLEDLHVVENPDMTHVRLRMMETIELGGMMRVSAPVGHGKSFACARAVEACHVAHPDLTVTWVELPGATRGRGLAAALYEQITGLAPGPKASLTQLRRELLEHFTAGRHLIICDEAQHVSNEALHLVRWMYDAHDSKLVVVFSGVPTRRTPYPPEITSRLSAHVELNPIADDDAPDLLRAMHPLFERMNSRLIKSMNKREALGEWRWWCKFLARAALYVEPDQVIDLQTVSGLIRGIEKT